ncbi:MAG: cytochrome c [Nitrospinae bacterium]|nr:cytochrome c [Nitrospinota bacterium]
MIRRQLTSAALAALVALAGCENYDLDLHDQALHRVQEAPRFLPPQGSVTVSEKRVNYAAVDGATLINPLEGDAQRVEKGKKLYEIFCIACHGPAGDTKNTPVADKFDPRPANLLGDVVMALTEGEIFQRVLDGGGVMPGYRYEVSDEEAWQITSYVLKLQNR